LPVEIKALSSIAFVEDLLCSRHLLHLLLFNPYFLIEPAFPFDRRGNQGSKGLNVLLNITQQNVAE